MGHNKNYTKFSEKKQAEDTIERIHNEIMNEIINDKTEEIIDEVEKNEDPIIKTENDKTEEIIDEVITEPIIEKIIKGYVINTNKLNVRKEPKIDSDVICIIDDKSEVIILDSMNDEEFYKVTTAHGAEGYCMKKYIEIK